VKRISGSIVVVVMVVLVVCVAIARAWRPASAGASLPTWNGQAPILSSALATPVAGPLAAMSVLLYGPGPEAYLPLVVKP
jgi:hypothetical protein